MLEGKKKKILEKGTGIDRDHGIRLINGQIRIYSYEDDFCYDKIIDTEKRLEGFMEDELNYQRRLIESAKEKVLRLEKELEEMEIFKQVAKEFIKKQNSR